MTSPASQADLADADDRLAQRMRESDVVMIICDLDGAVVWTPPRGGDWLTGLCTAPGPLSTALRDAAGSWRDDPEPATRRGFVGLWFVPVPVTVRRSRSGYAVAIVPTARLATAAVLPAMCHAARLDHELVVTLLGGLDLPRDDEVLRFARFIRHACADHRRHASDVDAAENAGQQLAWCYEEINLLYTITSRMTVGERPERFLRDVCDELLETLPYAWVGVLLGEHRARVGDCTDDFIVVGDHPPGVDYLRAFAMQMLGQISSGAAIVVDSQANPEHAVYSRLGRTVVVQAVASEGGVIGVLMVGDKQGADHTASSIDIKLLGASAAHMAVFLDNSLLYENLNRTFIGTLEALTSSIDAKDRYTYGHSRRVAHLSQELARAAGFDEELIERMHVAGLVHDIGKIGVPERVLSKPGKLTPEEFDWIKQHPEIGYRILKDIPQLADVLPGVLHHHERWDGAGYPKGLAAEQIPLIARLIGLADAFDAMSSTRTYRAARSRNEVFAEIQRCAGTQFDPALVPAFISLDFSEYDRLVGEQQAEQSGHVEAA